MNSIEDILASMVKTVEESKSDLFEIQEESRVQLEKIREALRILQVDIQKAIQEQDRLHILFKQARQNLVYVSQKFTSCTEKEIEAAYMKANEIQMQLFQATENENHLKKRRMELQADFSRVEETMKRSEKISLKVSVIVDYLTNDVWQLMDEAGESKQLREFGIRMLELQEEERKRLSREIHDGPAQTMAHLVIKSDLIEQIILLRSKEDAIQEIQALKKDVRDALAEVRRIIYDIRPMVLDDLGLVPAIQKYLGHVREKHQLETKLQTVGKEFRLGSKLEATIFRIVQESVNNALKHGKTTKLIRVRLEFGQKIHLCISDDGVGFDTNIKKEHNFGILGMQERVSLFHGELKVHSVINEGTTVSVSFPLDECVNEGGNSHGEKNGSNCR